MKKIVLALLLLLFAGIAFAQSDAAPQTPSDANGQSSATHHHGIAGKITAITNGKITLKTMDGSTATVTVNGQTKFLVDRQPAKQTDFKVGDGVLVRGEAAGENQWQADLVAKRSNNTGEADFRDALGKKFIVGEIKAINGVQLTILRPDGVTQTIAVDENTSFRKQGESVTLADFKIGDHIFGRGEVKDGTFVPAMLGWGDPMAMFNGQSGGAEKSQAK
jgi:outer membrane lipoprotein SlyB